jgi:NADPH:quinone reductase-like Zn-dependent oxidoreductase
MKAAVFHEFGGPDVVRIEDVPAPVPSNGEVRIAVRAAALNHLDLWARRGLPGVPLPHIGGSDIAGIIDSRGDGVTHPAIGQPVVVNPTVSCGQCEWCRRGQDPLCVQFRIIGEHMDGGFAQFVVVPAANVLPLPDGYDIVRAAAAPLAFLTAWRGLVSRARLQRGETVLITGASGGVATAAVAIARHLGARVLAITRTEHVERLRQLDVNEVFDRQDPDHRKRLFEATGRRGVDVIFDSVGQATWQDNIRSLVRGGRLVVYGATTGHAAATDLRFVFWKQVEILGTTMSNRHEFEAVMALVLRGLLEPVVDGVWPLARMRELHQRLERGEQFGKIVVGLE